MTRLSLRMRRQDFDAAVATHGRRVFTLAVYLFARERDGRIVGLTAFVNEEAEEVVVVNIVGDIDPRVLGRLISHMEDMPDLDELMSAVEQ